MKRLILALAMVGLAASAQARVLHLGTTAPSNQIQTQHELTGAKHGHKKKSHRAKKAQHSAQLSAHGKAHPKAHGKPHAKRH